MRFSRWQKDYAADATAKTDTAQAASSNNTNTVATLDTPFVNDRPRSRTWK
jgi:hypothetical protein